MKMLQRCGKQFRTTLVSSNSYYGDKFIVVDNSDGADYECECNECLQKDVQVDLPRLRLSYASMLREWIAQQKKERGITEMIRFRTFVEDVSQAQLNDLEKFADRILAKFGVDIEFTRHFADRMNDPRNKPAVKVQELQQLFKRIARNKAKNIRQNPDSRGCNKRYAE